MADRPYVRVGNKHELMDKDGEKIADLSYDDLMAHLAQFVDILSRVPRDSRHRTKVRLGEKMVEVSVIDVIEMLIQFGSSSRFFVVK